MTEYPPSEKASRQIACNFVYHAPKGDQTERYVLLRDACRSLAETIVARTPPGREQSCALTALEEAMMWANAAVARGE